ncbi:hypothetical protein ABW20_dc0102181 [Dactylellina cionopaga]|nr:hypothetical protein ABW20_dc0102181 [Dactylellina cionopaga]
MPDMNTLSVAAATTPTVLSVGLAHYLTKSKHRGKPTYHLGYHQGLELVRRFLIYASHRTVEELQAFTSQYVPVPTWVHVEEATIDDKWLDEAAAHLVAQLGPDGVQRVGGKRWWRWRVKEVKAEWIEMRRNYHERIKHAEWAPRTILYVHGETKSGWVISSVDEHRYQLQRHARKMKARVFARKYISRSLVSKQALTGLQDILASYLYLLSVQPASTIILSGDSAGGGAVAALLCILRDQNIPLPAGSILISPWVDLTHSFPSVISDNSGDYIPAHGFLHKSSPAWPPPTDEDIEKANDEAKQPEPEQQQSTAPLSFRDQIKSLAGSKELKEEVQGFDIVPPTSAADRRLSTSAIPKKGVISIMIEGHEIRIKDQIQLYTTNELLSHPLVSPVLQGSLGGLPPMMILVGGSEVLRDEQIYFAHKAANPRKYPPPSHVATAQQLGALNRWKRGTDVVLQVFDDCCHVTPTLAFTKPAKYMYRSIAKFGDWLFAREALLATARNANTSASASVPDTATPPLEGVDIIALSGILEPGEQLFSQDGGQIVKGDDTISVISSSSSTSSDSDGENTPTSPTSRGHHIARKLSNAAAPATYDVPAFNNHMIGCIKPEPVRRWMEGKKMWDSKYAKAKKRVQAQRAKEIVEGGYLAFEDDGSGVLEKPPPSALAGRRRKQGEVVPGRGFKPSYGLKLWSMIGSKQDAKTIATEEKKEEKEEKEEKKAAAEHVVANSDTGNLETIVEEGNLSSSSEDGDETSEGSQQLKKTQSQIDRLEAIASVPDAVLVDSPPGIVDVSAPYDRLGQGEDAGSTDKGKGVEVHN